jgi:phage regulator Rha-like protein
MNKLENKLSSREVASMMEMEHSKLLRKIDDINEDFGKAKIGFSKYWVEDTYKVEGNNKSYREFQITKRGCEFLANKTTGTKGNLFTDRYMDRFEEMKGYIENKVPVLSTEQMLELQFKYAKEVKEEVKELKEDFNEYKDNSPLFTIECKEIQAFVKKIGTKALGGYRSPAYNDKSLRGRVYADIQHQLKREFGVSRYEAIKRNQLEKATEIVNNYKAPTVLVDEIVQANNQICLEEVM